jgi:hypothetical protein
MAKFSTYGMQADGGGSTLIVEAQLQALSLESAWHKAVEMAFDACEPGTGVRPESITVWRVRAASESHD